MCDDFELGQDFELPEVPEFTHCEVTQFSTGYDGYAVDGVGASCGENNLFDTSLCSSADDSNNLLVSNNMEVDGHASTSLDDIDRIKKELDDDLSIPSHDINNLKERAAEIERAEQNGHPSFKSVRICATRHGCSGATNCNKSMVGPVGR